MKVRDRLTAFMKSRNITRRQLADAFSTPVKTMDSWRYNGTTPPAVTLCLLGLIEDDLHVRAKLGLSRRKECRPRGKPFQPGNPWRLNDERRKQLLAEKHSKVA